MRKLHKISCFVLKRKTLLEKDAFVSLYSLEQGKIVAMVKGVRKFTSKRAAHIQTGNLIKAEISETKSGNYLQGSYLVSGFMKLRSSEFIGHIYLILAVIDGLMPEGVSEPVVFYSIKRFFAKLGLDLDPDDALRVSLQEIIDTLGYTDKKHNLSELIEIAENNMEKKLPRNVIMSFYG